MLRLQHFYGENHLHHPTANINLRVPILDPDRFRLRFVQSLNDLQTDLGFKIIRYVLIPRSMQHLRRGLP